MNRLTIALLLLSTSAYADMHYHGGCKVPDTVVIVDLEPGKALVVYHNSADRCSKSTNTVLTSPSGISVKVTIDVQGGLYEDRERIVVTPLDVGMMAFPPEALVPDGDKTEIIVMGGLS